MPNQLGVCTRTRTWTGPSASTVEPMGAPSTQSSTNGPIPTVTRPSRTASATSAARISAGASVGLCSQLRGSPTSTSNRRWVSLFASPVLRTPWLSSRNQSSTTPWW